MIKYAAAYGIALIIMGVADASWLGFMANRFYRPIFGDIGLQTINAAPAILFYLIYPVGLILFVVDPMLRNGTPSLALLYGALFGFFTYATYDLTNQATLRNWTWQLTLVDVTWGTILAALAAGGTFMIISKLGL